MGRSCVGLQVEVLSTKPPRSLSKQLKPLLWASEHLPQGPYSHGFPHRNSSDSYMTTVDIVPTLLKETFGDW